MATLYSSRTMAPKNRRRDMGERCATLWTSRRSAAMNWVGVCKHWVTLRIRKPKGIQGVEHESQLAVCHCHFMSFPYVQFKGTFLDLEVSLTRHPPWTGSTCWTKACSCGETPLSGFNFPMFDQIHAPCVSLSHTFPLELPPKNSDSLPGHTWPSSAVAPGGSLQHPELRPLHRRRLGRLERLVQVHRHLRRGLPRAAPRRDAAAQQLREAGAGTLGVFSVGGNWDGWGYMGELVS